jgi:hypothetical protein
MQKKKALVFMAIFAVILATFLLGFLRQKKTEYYARKECFKHTESYLGGVYTYQLPPNVDCTPYKIELDAAFPGQY